MWNQQVPCLVNRSSLCTSCCCCICSCFALVAVALHHSAAAAEHVCNEGCRAAVVVGVAADCTCWAVAGIKWVLQAEYVTLGEAPRRPCATPQVSMHVSAFSSKGMGE